MISGRALGIVLLASLVANVWFLRRSRHAEQPAPTTTGAHISPLSIPATSAMPALPQGSYAALDRDVLERRVVEVERKIDTLLSADERWRRGQPTPEVADKLRPYLDRVFDVKAGSAAPYELDCRGGACQIKSSTSMDVWMGRLQALYPDRALYNMSFNRYAYVAINEPGEGQGRWLWWAIVGAADSAVRECLEHATARGDLSIGLTLDTTNRRVSVAASGSLANQPVGQCTLRAYENAAAATAVPPEATGVYGNPLRFELPLTEAPR